MRFTTRPALLAALVLLGGLAACSNDDGASPLASDDAAAGEQATDETEGGGRGGQGSGGDPSSEPLGTTRALLENLSNRTVPLRIDVVRLERNGDLVELGLLLTNEAEDDGSDELDYAPNTDWGGGPGINGHYDIREVAVVDPAAQRKYLPAMDDQEVCLCSGTASGEGVGAGQSTSYDATIGGLPEDVETVDVHVPGFPPITGVEIQG